MKRTDYQEIAKARTYTREIAAGLSRDELARRVFERYPDVWLLLTPALQEKWCWEQIRREKDLSQLPLAGCFDDADGVDVVLPRGEWERDQYREYAERYDRAARANLRKRDLLMAEYFQKFGEQLELGV